jgi:hypothetical protein
MITEITIDLEKIIKTLSDEEIVRLVKLACENIGEAGFIGKIREFVNDPKMDD